MTFRLGVQIGMLPGRYEQALETFIILQEQYSLSSAELQLEPSIYHAHFTPGKDRVPRTDILGVHLPFMGLDPVSADPALRQRSLETFYGSIRSAADCGAAYVVFHARTQSPVNNTSGWIAVLADLSERSKDAGIRFCLENADSLYDTTRIHQILHELPGVHFCFDIGHLYEHTFNLLTRYLPLSSDARLGRELGHLCDHTACMHIHNHDGFLAHQTLKAGKIDFSPLKNYRSLDIPLILESDYRDGDPEILSEDISYLVDLIA